MSNKRTKERALAPPPDKPVNWGRLRQVFGNLTHRGQPVLDDYVLSGVVIEARSPEEGVAATERLVVEKTRGESEN